MNYKIHCIPHTHWDREWYRSSNAFRTRLVLSFDMLIETLEADEDFLYYTFDGQVGAILDYLEVRPHMREKIQALVAKKRLFIGPWYIQPDLHFVSGESLLRNLLLGTHNAKALGHCMNVGWIPDAFGQIQTTPQLFHSFGFDGLFVWRGFDYQSTDDSAFLWESPNGDSILSVHYTLGYGHFRYFSSEPKTAQKEVLDVFEAISKRSQDYQVLFMQGSDHARIQKETPSILKGIRDFDIEISNPEHYIYSLKKSIKQSKRTLEVYRGDARSPELGRIHAGISSTRMDIKNQMRYYEHLLFKCVEPISVMSKLLGGNYDQDMMNYFLKILFKNQFHDSIYASSPENVNQSVENRLLDLRQGLHEMIWLNIRYIKDRIDRSNWNEEDEALIVYNTLGRKRNDYVSIQFYAKSLDFSLFDEFGNEIEYIKCNQLDEIDYEIENYNGLLNLNDGFDERKGEYIEVKVKICANQLPTFGYQVFRIMYHQENTKVIRKMQHDTSLNTFANEYLSLQIQKDGSLRITDLQTGNIYDKSLVVEDVADNGDEYNFDPIRSDIPISTQNIDAELVCLEDNEWEVKYRILHQMKIPKGVEDGRRSIDSRVINIQVNVSLSYGNPLLEIDVEIDNTVDDHLLRVCFTDSKKATKSLAEDHFGYIERCNTLRLDEDSKATETPLAIYPMQRFVRLAHSDHTFALISKDAMEYTVLNDETIAITLLRSVGWLGKADLNVRLGRASGYKLKTPSSQIHKKVKTHLAMCVGKYTDVQLSKLAEQFATPIIGRHVKGFVAREERFSNKATFLSFKDELELQAIKVSENKEMIVIRLLNRNASVIKDVEIAFEIEVEEAYLLDSKEDVQKCLYVKNNVVMVEEINKYSFVNIGIKK